MGEGNERRWVGKKGKMRVKMEGREEEMKQREREVWVTEGRQGGKETRCAGLEGGEGKERRLRKEDTKLGRRGRSEGEI